MKVEESRGERTPSESPEKKEHPDALEENSPVSDPAEDMSENNSSEVELSGLSLNEDIATGATEGEEYEEDPEAMDTEEPELDEEGDRKLPYDRMTSSDMSDEDEEYDESDEEESELERLYRLANEREQLFSCPSEDEPGIYLLCSAYSQDWFEKCEVMNEFLTSAFLGKLD